MTTDEFVTESEAAIAAALAKPMPVTGRAIMRRITTLGAAEKTAKIERARVAECRFCGVAFQGSTRRARFCSDECRRAEWRGLRRAPGTTVACPECESWFRSLHPNSRYCSATCRESGRVRRQREARAKRRRADGSE